MQEYILTLLQCKQDFIKIVQLIRAGCQMVKASRQYGILELFRQYGILELFQQCGIFELFRQCGILELFRQCGICCLFV
jgi:hypothetical protein